jgi:hypothetical protein
MWHNCFSRDMQVLSSLIFREGNGCADKLVCHSHVVTDLVWWDIIPDFVKGDFFRDRSGLPNFRFP